MRDMGQPGTPDKADLVARLEADNRGREPERLAIKYARMAESPLRFLRGTAHLFWQDWPKGHPLDSAPLAWACGDLHAENFGAFRGANGLVTFDLNDFDESALAPLTRDPVRFVTSLLVSDAKASRKDSEKLAGHAGRFLDAWAEKLIAGKPRWVERETAKGPVRDMLDLAEAKSRQDLLEHRTAKGMDGRYLKIDGKRTLAVNAEQEAHAKAILKAAAGKDNGRAFEALSIARRVAGTGSLGVERYIALVEGEGKPDGHWLIDVKEAVPSAIAPSIATPQPRWPSEADRIVIIQDRMQAACPALLRAVKSLDKSFVIRELQPSELKLDFSKGVELKQTLPVMGAALAYAQLRSSGRGGSASADALIQFASGTRWKQDILDYATGYSARVFADYEAFKTAWKDGAFEG